MKLHKCLVHDIFTNTTRRCPNGVLREIVQIEEKKKDMKKKILQEDVKHRNKEAIGRSKALLRTQFINQTKYINIFFYVNIVMIALAECGNA